MALTPIFDEVLRAKGWFESTLVPEGWIDADFTDAIASGGTAGAPSLRVSGAWTKSLKSKRKVTGTMADVDIVAKVAGSWTGV